MGREEIAATYLRYYVLKQQEDRSAVREVDVLVQDDPTEAWEVTLILVNTAPSDEALLYVRQRVLLRNCFTDMGLS